MGQKMTVRNINPAFGEPVEFEDEHDMLVAVQQSCPDVATLEEGTDFEYIEE